MPRVSFTANLQRHVRLEPVTVSGSSVREAIEAALAQNPRGRAYVLDDQGELRPHMAIFVDGTCIADRRGLTDPVSPGADIHVMQALSGG